jgi:hypothetical protein
MSRLPNPTRAPQILAAISKGFEAHGLGHCWLTLVARTRLEHEPDAAVAVLAALCRSAASSAALPSLPPEVAGLFGAARTVADQLADDGWSPAVLAALALKNETAQSVASNPILAALVITPYADIEDRVACLHVLLVAGVFAARHHEESFAVVADGARKARRIEGWRRLIAQMPTAASGADAWTTTFRRWGTESPNEPAAYRAFRRAVARAIAVAAKLSDKRESNQVGEPQGRLVLPRERPTAPESKSAKSAAHADASERARYPIARLVFDDTSNEAGAEPSQLELAVEAAVLPREVPLPAFASRTGARLAAFKFMEESDRLRWHWDHLHRHEIRVLVQQGSIDVVDTSPRLAQATLTLLVLATGLPVMDIPALAFEPGDGEWGITLDGLWVKPCYIHARSAALSNTHALYRAHTGGLRLRLPRLIQHALALCAARSRHATTIQALLGITASDAVSALSEWLDPIRANHRAGRFTHGRLQRALGVELAALARDDAAVHYIAGTAADVPPISAHYASYSDSALTRLYEQAVGKLFGVDA